MSSLGGNIRTIWITLRAMNYTQKVFDDATRQMQTLQKAELGVAQSTTQMQDASTHMLVAGAMLTTLSVMLGSQMYNLAASSTEGASAFANLNKNLADTKSALADTFYEMLNAMQVFTILNTVLNFIKDNKAVQILVGVLGVLVVSMLALWGVTWLVQGAVGTAGNAYAYLTGQMVANKSVLTTLVPVTQASTVSMQALAMSAMMAVGAFIMIYSALEQIRSPVADAIAIIGGLIAVLIALISLEGAASMGLALMGIAAGAAGAMAIAQQYGAFQMGTRAVPNTGPVFAHKGEIIYNPSTGRPTQVDSDITGGGVGRTTTLESTTVNIANVNTKADFDDVDEQIRRGLRKNMRDRR